MFHGIEISTTYQEIFREGVADGRRVEARMILLELGAKRLGAPGADVKARLRKIADLHLLRELTIRAFDGSIGTWGALMDEIDR
jgi:hypothetical protein